MIDEVLLTSICRPKQWKTISTKDLIEDGYPIYGANGKIGFYHTFTHEFPTVLITCRGATCGTINISEPKSYVNGNAMALDNLSCKVDMYFLKHFLEYRKLDDVISGSAQPQITGQGLKKVKIPLPPLPQQQKIANILDAADALRQKDKALLAKYDELTQALFLDMFGGNQDYDKIELGEVIKLIGGGTPSKEVDHYWNGNIPWASVKDLKTDRLEKTIDYISEEGVRNSATRIIPKGSLIVATRMAVGRAAICEIDVAINQDLKAIQIIKGINVKFLLYFFKSKESYFDSVSSGATVKGIKIEHITKLKTPIPPINIQNQFAERIQNIEHQKAIAQQSLEKSEALFNSLLQKAFKGELV
jgi:type I restriction enzyme S subunit